jgi:uncharacterized protein
MNSSIEPGAASLKPANLETFARWRYSRAPRGEVGAGQTWRAGVCSRARRNEILQLGGRWGARNVRVFGSVARGEKRQQSDIDFLVELAPDRSLLDHGGLLADLETLLGVSVDLVSDGA